MAPSVDIEPHTQNTETGQVLRRSHLGTFSQLNCSVCTGAYILNMFVYLYYNIDKGREGESSDRLSQREGTVLTNKNQLTFVFARQN